MRGAIFPIILILMGVALFFTFTNAQYQEVKTLKEDKLAYEDRFQLIEQLVQVRDEQLLPKYNSINAVQLDRLNKLLPRQVNNIRLINDMQKVLAGFGTELEAFSFEEIPNDQSKNGIQKMGVSITFSASYQTFTTILKELERSLRIIDIESVSFDAGNADLYTYTVMFVTYWIK